MSPKSENHLRLEIGTFSFSTWSVYSRLLIEEQQNRLRELTDIVLATKQVAESTNEQLVRLPTGDGMALVFHASSEEPAHCALEIAAALKSHPEVQVRMGIHSGPVSAIMDVSGRANIAGSGINMAQRVMDCADAGHILLSRHVAEDFEQYGHWKAQLHDLGECEVKHGLRLGVVNLQEYGVLTVVGLIRQKADTAAPFSDDDPPKRRNDRAFLQPVVQVRHGCPSFFSSR